MPQVRFTGWKPGLNKISLNSVLRERVPLSLADAKRVVDRILEGETVSVDVESRDAAETVVRLATECGVICAVADSAMAETVR